MTRCPYGGRKRSVVRDTNALTFPTSARDMLSSSASSTTQTPATCIAASLAECRDLVRKPRLCQCFEGSGFAQTLVAFEYQHAIGLTSGHVHAGDSRDQPLRRDRAHIGGVLGSEVSYGPGVEAGFSIPLTAAQIVQDRVVTCTACAATVGDTAISAC